jgi:Fe2+ or Zn2+ uptake regulation protein
LIEEFSLIKELVEQKGYKFTIQRKIILEELLSAGRHLKAEEIYEKVKKRNIGMATVYRTL